MDKLDLGAFYASQIPRSYLNCTEDIAMPPGEEWGWHPRFSNRLGLYRLVQMPGSHEVLFTEPGRPRRRSSWRLVATDGHVRSRPPARAGGLARPAAARRARAGQRAVELLDHEGTAIAGGWSYAELRERAEAARERAGDRAGHARAAALAEHAGGDRGVARDPAGGRDRGGDDAAAARRRDREGGREGARDARARRARALARRGRRRSTCSSLEDLPARGSLRGRRHRGRRRRDHRLHLRHDRHAEGLRALPPRPAGGVRHVRARRPRPARRATCSAARRRWRSRSGSAGWCCSRCASAPRRRRSPGRAGGDARRDPRHGDHDAVHRADRLPRDAAAAT